MSDDETTGRVVCAECRDEGERSRVYPGPTTRTLMAGHRYYDEDGRLHISDPNKTTTAYVCSRGHRWEETR